MEALQIAQLKDDILNYLFKPENNHEALTITELYKDLKIKDVPMVLFRGYIEEMVREDLLHYFEVESGDKIMYLNEGGERLIHNGGFVKRVQNELAIAKQQEEDRQINRVKTKLEIDNLKLTKRISIIALIVSIISIALSVIFKIF